MHRINERLNTVSPMVYAAILFFMLQVFLAFNSFLPTLRDLNMWDEAIYINSGRMLIEGQWPTFAQNPLVAVLYAILYLFFSSSSYWMTHLASWGHFVLFALMWWGCFLSAYEMRKILPRVSPFVAATFILVVPITTDILINSSDALFAAMSAFALWMLMRFYNTSAPRDLAGASVFVALSAFSRNDGLVVFVLFALVILWLVFVQKQRLWVLLYAVLPFLVMVGGYQLALGLRTGQYGLGTVERSFVAFQQGQYFIYENAYNTNPTCGENPLACAVEDVDRLYGTPQENDNSVLIAIARNPQAYASRLLQQVKQIPGMVYIMFGKRTAPLVMLFMAVGFFAIFRQHRYKVFILMLPWLLFLGVYFLTFFRVGYLQLAYVVYYLLASLGVAYFVETVRGQKGIWIWTGLLLGLLIVFVVTDISNVQYFVLNMALLLFAAWFAYLMPGEKHSFASFLALFAVAVLLARQFSPPVWRIAADAPEEQGVVVMQSALAPGSVVMAGSPGGVWAARLMFEDANTFSDATSPAELHLKLQEAGIAAIWVDPSLSNMNAHIWQYVEPGIADGLYETLYIGREGSVRVLRVLP